MNPRAGSQRFLTDKILLNYDAVAKKQYLCLCDVINAYWHHNNHLHFNILAMSVSFCYMWYCHGNSFVQMLISLVTKNTPSYTQGFRICRCTNVHYVWPRKGRNSWFERDYNINNLCDNKNDKFHCFHPHKKQPLGTSPENPIHVHTGPMSLLHYPKLLGCLIISPDALYSHHTLLLRYIGYSISGLQFVVLVHTKNGCWPETRGMVLHKIFGSRV